MDYHRNSRQSGKLKIRIYFPRFPDNLAMRASTSISLLVVLVISVDGLVPASAVDKLHCIIHLKRSNQHERDRNSTVAEMAVQLVGYLTSNMFTGAKLTDAISPYVQAMVVGATLFWQVFVIPPAVPSLCYKAARTPELQHSGIRSSI